MPRFVILEHDHPELHWDFMLEMDGILKTWRLGSPPVIDGDAIAATPLPDHRLLYLDYEGPVSGGRGTVKRWDGGEYDGQPTDKGWRAQLRGGKLQGWAVMDAEMTVRFCS
ncbi:MAG: hypothetical protein HY040_08635 [Planctomycetes bacterium]|nr:hypothetical protein [Planctomycetota bacterium]